MARKRSPKKETQKAVAKRIQRLLAQVQGRRLDEAYLNFPEIRQEMKAEVAAGRPDALVTPEMIELLEELIAQKRRSIGVERPLVGVRAQAQAVPSLDQQIYGALTAASVGESTAVELAPALRRAPVANRKPRGVEIYAATRLFFSTDTVVIVPGFLASSLADTMPDGYGLIWISPLIAVRDELGELQLGPYDGTERDLDVKVHIQPQGAIPFFYDLLRLDLELRRYTVEIFPVDWRKNLEVAAGLLAARLQALAGESRRPIHLIAHSQGALVARRALGLLGSAAAQRIVQHLVLLGPANYGSFSAAFAIAGNHSLIPTLRRLAVEPPQGFQPVLASMTGAYQLLPFDRGRVPWLAQHDYRQPSFWKMPIDVPRLRQFHAWARSLDTAFFNDRTAVILGDNHGAPTTGGLTYSDSLLQDAPDFGLVGDGTVPSSCAVLPGTRTYLAPGTEHSMLATYRHVIAAVRDVLSDRTPALQEVSSNPADYLQPLVGPSRGMAAPGVRAPQAKRRRAAPSKPKARRKSLRSRS